MTLQFVPVSFGAVDSNPPAANADILQEAVARAAWNKAIDTLDAVVPNVVPTANAIAQLSAEGKWSGRLDGPVDAWFADTQKLLADVVRLISMSPGALAAIDAQMAADSGVPTVVPGVWKEFLAELQPPPLLNGIGFLPALFAAAARIFSNPAVQRGTFTLLKKLGPWVAGTIISENVASSLNTEAMAIKAKGENLGDCIKALANAANAEERAAIERTCGAGMEGSSTVGWLMLGAVVGGLGLLFWQNRKARLP